MRGRTYNVDGKDEKRIQLFVGKPEMRRPRGRRRRRLEDNITMELGEIG